jgi:hypothetical protein
LVAVVAKFFLDFLLAERFKRRWQTIEVKRKYSAPIIRAVDDLAARLETVMIEQKNIASWLRKIDDSDLSHLPFDRYFHISTLYLLARLICWVEILKKEQTYLEFSSTRETRQFNAYINLIYATLSSPSFTSGRKEPTKSDYWMFFHYLSGVGEMMMRRDERGFSCISFPEFCREYSSTSETKFRTWMLTAENLFIELTCDEQDLRWRRIQVLWFCLDRFLEFVDPTELRTTRDRDRSKKIPEDLKLKVAKRAEQLGLSLIQ